MKIYVRKVQNGKLDQLQKWADELRTHEREVLTSLNEENIECEALSSFRIGDEEYVVAVEYSRGQTSPSNKESEINKKHIQVLRETLTPPIALQSLYKFTTVKE
jgi:hypothetical protein